MPGYITAVPVTDNQHVGAHDVIARIDDRDYRVALDQAQAQVAAAEANIQNIDAQITVQQAQVSASQAQVEQAQATLLFAQQQAARYEDLAQRGAGTVQNAQQSSLDASPAGSGPQECAGGRSRPRSGRSTPSKRSAAAPLRASRRPNAQRDQAELNLSYTTVTAAQAGRVVNLTAAVGPIRPGRHEPDNVRARRNLGHGELQGDATRATCGPASL